MIIIDMVTRFEQPPQCDCLHPRKDVVEKIFKFLSSNYKKAYRFTVCGEAHPNEQIYGVHC